MVASAVPKLSTAVPAPRTLGRLLLYPAIAAISFLTLIPTGSSREAALTPFWCLRCGDFGSVDVALNALLFIPFGLALGLVGVGWRRVVLSALLTTAVIEALQLTIIPGRDASISDVLSNSAGGAIGAALALSWRQLLLPEPAVARVLVAVLTLSWSASRLGTAWLLVPSLPDTVWYGQIAPRDVYPADFRGEVLRADIGSIAPRQEPMPELRDALDPAAIGVRARVDGAARTRGLASVISVLDEHRSEILVLGQEGSAARFRVRLRAADALLRTPSVKLVDAFPPDAGGPIEISGFRSPGRLSLASAVPGRRVSQVTIALSPGLGWALLLPFETGLTPEVAATGTAALAVAVLVLIGYCAGMALPGRTLAATGAAVLLGAAGLWSPSIVFTEANVAASEVLAAAVGAILGVLSASRIRR